MSKFTVNEDTDIKSFLESFYLGKAKINKLLSSNYYINDKLSNSKSLNKGDIVEFDLDVLDKTVFPPYDYNLRIVYEDEYLVIVEKPEKMLTHPDGNRNDTLANAISYYYKKTKQNCGVRVIQRLDYETSGLIIFPKDPLSQSFLSYQIEKNTLLREYVVLVEGKVKQDTGVINAPIGRNKYERNKYLVTKSGKNAITRYEVIERNNNYTKLKVYLETGRTHQIRVHFKHLGHPIVGDELYGKISDRLYLHAKRLGFIHPNTRKYLEVVSGDLKWNL